MPPPTTLTAGLALAAAAAVLGLPASAGAESRRIPVPLDHANPGAGSMTIGIERTRASGRRRGTLVILAGGPGESATAFHRDSLATAGAAVRRRYDIVSIDARGTGRSGLVRCPALQRDPRTRSTAGAEACARALGARRGAFTVRDLVGDLEAVRRALRAERLSLFGVSFGTKLAMRYAQAYPDRVERLLLDSVLPPEGPSATGLEIFGALPRVLGELCLRARCERFTGDLGAELTGVVEQMATAPLSARLPDRRGRRAVRSVDAIGIFDLLLELDFNPAARDALPSAVVAARRGDPAPLVRLYRLAMGAVPPTPVRRFSVGAYAAGSCEDLEFPWDPAADPATRREQALAHLRGLGPGALGPFTPETVFAADFLNLCQRWPAPAVPARRGDEALPNVPMLLVNGAEDLRTPLEGARAVAGRVPAARLLEVPTVGHSVIGSDGSGCALRAARAFLLATRVPTACRRPRRLAPPIGLPPASLDALTPFPRIAGRVGRTVRALDLTIDDLALAVSAGPARGGGLRGGAYSVRGNAVTLRGYEFVPGVRVSATPRRRALRVRISGPAAARGTLTVTRRGSVRGRLGGRGVRTRLSAGLPQL